jgi:hypothetical protein
MQIDPEDIENLLVPIVLEKKKTFEKSQRSKRFLSIRLNLEIS